MAGRFSRKVLRLRLCRPTDCGSYFTKSGRSLTRTTVASGMNSSAIRASPTRAKQPVIVPVGPVTGIGTVGQRRRWCGLSS